MPSFAGEAGLSGECMRVEAIVGKETSIVLRRV